MYATTAALFGWLPNLTKLMLLRVQVISSQSTWQSSSLKVDKFGCICFLPKWMKNIFQWKFLIEWRRESSRRIRETAIPHQLVKISIFRRSPVKTDFDFVPILWRFSADDHVATAAAAAAAAGWQRHWQNNLDLTDHSRQVSKYSLRSGCCVQADRLEAQ